jgi:capsular exopolysaccharide synthesis family protein
VELADYLRVLRRRWRLIALSLVVCIAAAGAATLLQPKQYRSSTRLLVSGSSSVSAIDEISRRELANQRAVAYAQIAGTGPAVAEAVKESGAKTYPTIRASADGTSPFITILAIGSNAQDVASVANIYVSVLPKVVTELDKAPSAAPPTLSVLEAAGVPSSPSSPRPVRNVLAALVIGAVLGVASALVREAIDARIRDSAEIERFTDVGVLGVVPKEYGDEELISVTRPRSRRAESYRQIRTNLEFTSPEGAPRSLVVTSAGPSEGKTTVATNLAVIASHTGKNVVIVDADLRKPRVHEVFRLPAQPGLTDVLSGTLPLDSVLQRLEGERLTIVASGPQASAPSELLGSAAMVELIQQLEQRFDFVIIDSPPVLPVTDALVLGVNTGGVVVVTRLGVTKRNALRRTIEAVHRVRARVLGVVGNAAVEHEEKRYGYGAGYGYGYLHSSPARAEDLRPVDRLRPGGRRSDAEDASHSFVPLTGRPDDTV